MIHPMKLENSLTLEQQIEATDDFALKIRLHDQKMRLEKYRKDEKARVAGYIPAESARRAPDLIPGWIRAI